MGLGKRIKISIAAKLTGGFAFLVVVFMVSNWYAMNFIRSHLLTQQENLLHEKAQNASIQVGGFYEQLSSYNRGLSQIYETNPRDADKITAASTFIIQNNPYIKKIVYLRPNGREIIKVEQTGNINAEKLFFEIITDTFESAVDGKTSISKVYFLEDEPGPFINIYTPISSNTQDHDVIKMQISLISLWDIISQVKLGKTGFAYIVDSDGRLIAHPNKTFLAKNPILSGRPSISPAIKNLPASSWPDGKTYNNEINILVVSQAFRIPNTEWVVVFEQAESEAFYFMNFIRSFFFASVIITATVLIAISYLLSNHIVQSITVLKQGAFVLRQGTLSSRIKLTTGDEFEELGDAFNSMATQMQNSFQQLEDQRKRANKTAELLLRRDLDLRLTNDEMEQEKEKIVVEKEKFSVVLSGITDAVIAVDLHNHILTFNAAAERVTGFEVAEAIGKYIGDVIKLRDKDHELDVEEYSPQTVGTKEGLVFNRRYIRLSSKNNQAFVNVLVGKIKEGSKINLGGIISIHDLSEEQKLEEMKLDFVSMAAHELRTPLTSIRGYMSLFLDEYGTNMNENQMLLLKRVDIASQQLSNLVEDLLSVSRIEKGAFSITPKPVEWVELVKGVVDQVALRAKEKNQTLTFDPGTLQQVTISADRLRISEVVTNLVSNAINYTQPGGTIHVSLEQAGSEINTHIKDTGEGIPADAMPHLFTKFFRASTGLTQKGTGLGLYISKAIVEKHGGKIWVESVVGKGSTFSFSLPTIAS